MSALICQVLLSSDHPVAIAGGTDLLQVSILNRQSLDPATSNVLESSSLLKEVSTGSDSDRVDERVYLSRTLVVRSPGPCRRSYCPPPSLNPQSAVVRSRNIECARIQPSVEGGQYRER